MQRRREAAGAPSPLPLLQVWESSLPTPPDPKERGGDSNPGSDPGRPWKVLGATQPSPRNRSRFRGSGSCPASRAVLKPHEALAQLLPTTGTPGSEGLIAPCEIAWSTLQSCLTWASPIPWQRGSSLRLTRSTLPTAPWCSPPSPTPQRMYSWP
ncbi:receptor activity-modifying protein 2 isoform X3 [Symphalangus syndactylus]|uniref:receptor activity-modifying protein 2 isoform X3 n=1 Tax=Symphalangus syndactylus TaxID=9590 RepID=UPI0030055318